jgi:hypothetical protein
MGSVYKGGNGLKVSPDWSGNPVMARNGWFVFEKGTSSL